MSAEEKTNGLITPEMEEDVAAIARDRARNSRWDLNIAIFLFAVLILVIILVTYTKAGPEIVAPVAAGGLLMVWLTGWRRGKLLYYRFYREEMARLERDQKKVAKDMLGEKIEETIEEQVQKALRERWKS